MQRGLYTGWDNFSRDYALPSGHEVIVVGGVATKRGASLSARQRDAHDTSTPELVQVVP